MSDTNQPWTRDQLIANCQWWAGWALDNNHVQLHELLLAAAGQMKDD